MNERILYNAAAGFEAARRLEAPPPRAALHGHSFVAHACVRAPGSAVPGWAPFAGGETDALRERLRTAVAPLDYQLLNEHVAQPSDENLASWIRARLAPLDVEWTGVHSTHGQGVDIGAEGAVRVWRRYQFEAAHRLPRVAPGHKCGRMHGHGFAVVLHAQGADGAPLDTAWAPLHQQLHHACLNDIAGLENPTSEIIASWLWSRLHARVGGLCRVTVHETATCGAHFDGTRYRIWKDLGFDSAVRLARAPRGDSRGGVHGHSFRLRLHLGAPLDTVLGWTIDFGDVKAIFGPVFERLDHQPLHELPGVADAGVLGIARWARGEAVLSLPQLERIDLLETSGCGVAIDWGPETPALPA